MHLTEEQKKFYAENGFIKLTNIFTEEEMDKISDEYNHVFMTKSKDNMEAAWEGKEMKEQANFMDYSVKSVHALQYHSAVFSEMLRKPELLDALEDTMHTKNILLHHTKAHFKPPENGAPYLMHQDYHYFPFKHDSMVAAFIHVDAATPENGGLCVYPGSHKLGPLKDVGQQGKDEHFHYMDPKEWPIENATPVKANRGDVVIFSYLLVHGSYLNLSTKPRRMFLAQYYSAEDVPLVDTHKSPGQGWVLRGRNDKRPAVMAQRYEH